MTGSRRRRIAVSFCGLLILLIVLTFLNIEIGSVHIDTKDIWGALIGRTEGVNFNIIRNIRLPRLLAALILGGALSVSGFLLQTFFANPIAGPFVLGISSGAKLVVALTMIVVLSSGHGMNSLTMVIAAFCGALLSTSFILAISKGVRKMSMLVICGVMIGYICSAITDFVVTFADDSNIVNLHNWSLGSFSGISWNSVIIMSMIISIILIVTFCISKPMGAYQLGENYATNMGVNVRTFRVVLILLSSILSATVTAFAGPVSFVGVAVPHIIRHVFKSNKPIVMIPGCFLGGAAFCLFADLIARTAFAPTELSISSVTALIGAPIVISMMMGSANRKEGQSGSYFRD